MGRLLQSLRTSRATPARLVACLLLAGAAALLSPAMATEARPPRRGLPRVTPPWQHDWANGGVFYEIFVRSFADSDGDGIGDLPGLVSRLDYLNDGDPATTSDLGVDAIWLMPVFASPSYHGYDVTDYERINPDYGTEEDFATLCREAHRRGIRIIMDFVVNHSGDGHPWFVDSASGPGAAKRAWYVWRSNNPGWKQPWNIYTGGDTWHPNHVNPAEGSYFYGVFWGGMPDLNYGSPEVREEVKRLAALWLARGADGFRLDAARYLVENSAGEGQQDQPETHAFWRELATHVRRIDPEAVLVGENWADARVIATYYGSTRYVAGGDELPMNFNFPLAGAIVQGANGSSPAAISAAIREVQRLYPTGVIDAPFLTNHDQVRVATQLGAKEGRLKNAAAILLSLPGAPFMYYGEEVGIANGTTSGDESKRTPMPWDGTSGGGFTTGTPWFPFAPGREAANVAVQTGNTGSLLSRYRSLIHARAGSAALRQGSLELLTPTVGANAVLAFLRTSGGEQVLVVHNLSDSFLSGVGPFAVQASGFEAVFVDPGMPPPGGRSGAVTVTLAPRGTGIWRAR